MSAIPLETRVFIVNTGAAPTLHASRIEAAYYKTENGFTTFKDTRNQPVYTVRDDHLVSVERAHGAEPLIASFIELLNRARDNGNARGRIGTEVSESPRGVVTETGFDITIVCVDGVDSSRSTDAPVECGNDVHVTVQGSALRHEDLASAVSSASLRRR